MDLSSGFDIPNPYGLLASDFNYDMDGYRSALGFLGDLATGTPEDRALEVNHGDQVLMRSWQRSDKFRRVLAKARKAAADERAAAAAEAVRGALEALAPPEPQATFNQFVKLEDAPPARSTFSHSPSPHSWGQA